MTVLARIISFISNPLFVVLPIPYLFVYWRSGNSEYAQIWLVISLLFLVIAGFIVFLEVERGVFSDLDVSHREQRPLLFLIAFIICAIYLGCLVLFQAPRILMISAVGIGAGILVTSFVNRWIKASIHVATNTCVLLSCMIMYQLPLVTLLLIPLIAWSRIYIKRHTLSETIAGGIVGVLLTLLMYTTLKYLFHITL